MPLITLISDWNRDGYYQSALKGKLIGLLPNVQVVDISHQVPSFDYVHAAFLLRGCYKTFPKGTVHLICVNSEALPGKPHVAIAHQGNYFIGADNGIFGLVFGNNVEKIFLLEHSAITTFPEYDVFADAAVFLAQGGDISLLGAKLDKLNVPEPIRPLINSDLIDGSVLHIDVYRNVITNITHDDFYNTQRNRRFEILVNSNYNKISTINRFYNDTKSGKLLAIFNSAGFLEIAVNNGFAADLLGLDKNARIRIKFYDSQQREELKLI